MQVRGHTQEFAYADFVFEIMVTGSDIKIKTLKARNEGMELDHNDPRLASLRAAVQRLIDGDVT